MASKIKVDQLETADGSGTIALQNQLSGMTSASMPTGSVLQVVQGSHSTAVNQGGTSFADTGLTQAITPSSASKQQSAVRPVFRTKQSAHLRSPRSPGAP